ncbi:MAG TPA: hypothetical protein VFX25_06425 [Streptosporangiaceae bacterium]|nr:hypothetical protein [Streptosporangiaceae bacterium]
MIVRATEAEARAAAQRLVSRLDAETGTRLRSQSLHVASTDLGMEAFILSGYPHAAECDLFARHVLPRLEHGPLLPRTA